MLLHAQAKALVGRETRRAGVIMTYVEASPILQRLDMKKIQGPVYNYNLQGIRPGVGFRGVNGSYKRTVGIINPQSESLKIHGGRFGVDSFILETQGEQTATNQEMGMIEAQARHLNRMVFDGNEENDPAEFDGFNRRLTGTQVISAGTNGAPLQKGMLDALLAAVPGANAIYAGQPGIQLMTALLDQSSQVTIQPDEFGKKIMYYGTVPIYDAGPDENDDHILDFDEDDGQGNFDTTSIYAIRFGSADREQDVFGIESPKGLHTRNLGEVADDDTMSNDTIVEWFMSLATASRNCAARLKHIENAIA